MSSKMNYMSKVQNIINSIILEKLLTNINYKTVILKTNTIANTMLDISNKFLELKNYRDIIKYMVKKNLIT